MHSALLAPLRLLWFIAVLALVTTAQPTAQTQARCGNDFLWMSSSQGLTPCLLAAFVWETCFTGGWDVPALVPQTSYTNPNSTTANLCSCSWTAYNLLSACTVCQGFDTAVQAWDAYSGQCGGYLTDTWFPANVTLPESTAIPYWAGLDPTSWSGARFNTTEAKNISQQNHPDLVQDSAPSGAGGFQKSKGPIGAIVGGVVGGGAVLALGGAIALCYIRRAKRSQTKSTSGIRPFPCVPPPMRTRSTSGLSASMGPRMLSVASSPRPGAIYTARTLRTHTGSAHWLSRCGPGYTSSAGPAPPRPTAPNRAEIIEPFTLFTTSPSSRPATARKGAAQTMRTVATNTAAAHGPGAGGGGGGGPALMHIIPEDATLDDDGDFISVQRTRRNQPAYSRTPVGSHAIPSALLASAPARPRHEKAAPSVDTQASYDSQTTAVTTSCGDGPVHGPRAALAPPPERVVATAAAAGQSG